MGHKESVKDADRIVGHIYEYPGGHRSVVEELAEYADVPVLMV